MKKMSILFLLVALPILLYSQDNTELYCKVTLAKVYLGKHTGWKDSTMLSLGNDPDLYNHKIDAQKLKQVESLKTDIDILNFMSKLGWRLLTGTLAETWEVNNRLHQTTFYFYKIFE